MSGNRDSGGSRKSSTAIRTALVVVALLVLLYSVLVATRPLLGVTIVVWIVGLYFLWQFFHLAERFVSAVERIAAAMEDES